MQKINVKASIEYDVLVGDGILADCGKLAADVLGACSACIITDDNVAPLYLDAVAQSFADAGFSVVTYVFKHGEENKTIETVSCICEFLAENRLTRSDIVVALGGGITGDTAGFAAAVYLRGIRFVQIPTTFLAAIDSSVGGKTGVNLTAGKNLAGAFHQPSLVICDPQCFKTMQRDRYLDGTAEAVKYAVLKDRELISLIDTDITETIVQCVTIKRDVVSKDEFDRGERQLLNLGHTFGHAIEKLSGFEITHGHAVAIGMVIAAKGGEWLKVTEKGTADELSRILSDFDLPVRCPFSAQELAETASGDKKRSGSAINLVLPERIGKCRLYKADVKDLCEFAQHGLN